jgi:glycosyltransferase involved in cell wall biosynthesis
VVVGCLGRFHHVKGQDNFVKAAAIVAHSHANVRFLMVGTDCDEHNASLMGWIHEHNLQDYFVLLGERDDVPICLTAMDIFCMPSRTEGFPNGLGEAMAMGLPAVTTEVGDTAILAGAQRSWFQRKISKLSPVAYWRSLPYQKSKAMTWENGLRSVPSFQ